MIKLDGVSKHYVTGEIHVPVLRNICLSISQSEFVALTGQSGSGKTTLMNIIGLLDKPSSGSLAIDGYEPAKFSPEHAARFRNASIGLVFQAFHLLPHLTALDNVALPLIYRGIGRKDRRAVAEQKLDQVGLGSFLARRPAELSGGQRQRVAIARALIGDPKLLLADEPTGNLDSRAADEVMNLFVRMRDRSNLTTVLVTHDPSIARRCHRQIILRDGSVPDDRNGETAMGSA
jgi:putative ABC transport system ATP-binding protein